MKKVFALIAIVGFVACNNAETTAPAVDTMAAPVEAVVDTAAAIVDTAAAMPVAPATEAKK